MNNQKYYVVGVTDSAVWDDVHNVLTQDGTLEDNIPTRAIQCTDIKEHSPTRAVYLMTDQEAAELRKHPSIEFVHINPANYPDQYPPMPDKVRMGTRYNTTVKNYRNFTGLLPTNPDIADANRAGYQLLRCAQYENPWQDVPSTTVINSTIPNTNTGKNIDLVVSDEACWFGHVEFQSNSNEDPPNDYIGGNPLPGNGTCGILDMVLEGPYYIDPAWFNASPGTRLTTRWDGTIVPVEQEARNWWKNSANRSAQFVSAGTVDVPDYYTRSACNGTNTAKPDAYGEGHGTACAGQAYGRTYGWAYNANKWYINAIGGSGLWPVDRNFDIIKIFHNTKPVNPLYGTRNPTVSSNSWGWREQIPQSGWFNNYYYYWRQGTSGRGGVFYQTKPAFMYYLGSSGDASRSSSELLPCNLTTSGKELVDAGVIFVVAAGNSNQQTVGSAHPNYNNYWASTATTPLAQATHLSLDSVNYAYNTINRRGFPAQIGKYTDNTGTVVYPVIAIGALSSNYQANGQERKVNYSNAGDSVDCYAPGDGTLTSNVVYTPEYARYDSYPGGLTPYDCRFSGTSSACPTAAGLIATAMETNRSWTWQDVRNWIQSLTEQSDVTFYQGPDPTSPTDSAWADLNSLWGGKRQVLYNNITNTNSVILSGSGLSLTGAGLTVSVI